MIIDQELPLHARSVNPSRKNKSNLVVKKTKFVLNALTHVALLEFGLGGCITSVEFKTNLVVFRLQFIL